MIWLQSFFSTIELLIGYLYLAKIQKIIKEELKGKSLATEKWRTKYQSQINELEKFLDTINDNTSINDIKAEIAVISEKYHPRNNFWKDYKRDR